MWGNKRNPSLKLFKWPVEGVQFMALCVTTTAVTRDLPNQMGEKQRNNRTFTKGTANVKSLLMLLPCSSQLGQMIEKSNESLFKPVS